MCRNKNCLKQKKDHERESVFQESHCSFFTCFGLVRLNLNGTEPLYHEQERKIGFGNKGKRFGSINGRAWEQEIKDDERHLNGLWKRWKGEWNQHQAKILRWRAFEKMNEKLNQIKGKRNGKEGKIVGKQREMEHYGKLKGKGVKENKNLKQTEGSRDGK